MLPRHSTFDDFLPAADARALLDFVLSHDDGFAAAQVTSRSGHKVDLSHRNAASLKLDWGAEGRAFRDMLKLRLPRIFAACGMREFAPVVFELECVAHRDGGKFGTHIDTLTDRDRQDSDRVVSAVYYFCREPRRFTGGTLALYAIGDGGGVEIEPLHNRLVVFPSFVPHEVLPVSVPGNSLADARFSINCWLRRKRS